jgi:Single-strand binding protein family
MPDPQPQALHQPTRHLGRPQPAVDRVGPTSLAPPLAPGALLACHGVHRPPGPRAGQTARPGSRKGASHDRGQRQLRRQPHRRPRATAHRQRHRPSHVPSGRLRAAGPGAVVLHVIVWRDQAEHAAESLAKGSRVVVVGRLQQRVWTTEDGSARSVVEVVADELGPSLRWATATTARATRSQSQ